MQVDTFSYGSVSVNLRCTVRVIKGPNKPSWTSSMSKNKILARIYRNGNPCTLLLEMKNSTATFKYRMDILTKLELPMIHQPQSGYLSPPQKI